MKSNWQTKEIDDACEVEYGTRVVNKRDGGSVYSVYGGGGATFHMDTFNREYRMIVARFAMSERCTRFVKGKFFLNDSGLTLSPKDSKLITQDFLDWQLLSLNNLIHSLAKGSAQKNLDLPAFRKVKITYPDSVDEQKRIVTKLDKIFKELEKAKEFAEKNLQNSKELFNSHLQSVFLKPKMDWKSDTLENLSQIKGGGTPSKSNKSFWIGEIPWVSPKDMKFEFITDSIDHISNEAISGSTTSLMPIGTILLVVRSGILERTIPIAITAKEVAINQDLKAILPNGVVLPKFLYFVFKASERDILSKVSKGATVHRLQSKFINEMKIHFPQSLEEQKKVIKQTDDFVERVTTLEDIYNQKKQSLEEFKKSVLKKAFNGEL